MKQRWLCWSLSRSSGQAGQSSRCLKPLGVLGLALGLALLGGGCPEKPQPPMPDTAPEAPEPVADPAVADIPLDDAKPADPARLPRPPQEPPDQVAARYILIGYQGAEGITSAQRSDEEAARRARRLSQRARQQGQDFLALARPFSEVPEAERGELIIFKRGQLAEPFERAAFSMGEGQVSEPVKTKFGYYVIARQELEEFSSAHILVQYKGADSAPVAITRTKEEARKKAEGIGRQAAGGADFAVLAGRVSDSPSRLRGGVLRPMVPGQMPPAYDNYLSALTKLQVGEVSPAVETPFGFHVIKRLKLERISASHILISHKDSDVKPRVPRHRYEAERLALKVRREARAADADFAKLAQTYSDDPASAEKGGDLGLFARGMMPPRFEQIAFSLKVGELSDVVETGLGYHIIKRTR